MEAVMEDGQKQIRPAEQGGGQALQQTVLAKEPGIKPQVLDHRQEMFGEYYNDPLGR